MTSDFKDSSRGAAVEYDPGEDSPKSDAEKILRDQENKLLGYEFVTGTGIGRNAVGDDAIIIYVREKSSAKELPSRLGRYDVIIEVTGDIEAY